MEQAMIDFLTTQWPAIAILSVGGYFLVKYFMTQLEKKDTLNQSNLDRFIWLVEKTNDVIGKFSTSLDWIHPKLNEMHDDIKSLKK